MASYPLRPFSFPPPLFLSSRFPVLCVERPKTTYFRFAFTPLLFLPLRPLFFCGPLSWQHRVSRVSGGGGGPEPSLSVPDYCSRRDATWVDVGTLALCVDVRFLFCASGDRKRNSICFFIYCFICVSFFKYVSSVLLCVCLWIWKLEHVDTASARVSRPLPPPLSLSSCEGTIYELWVLG